jgi:hypothetical protein
MHITDGCRDNTFGRIKTATVGDNAFKPGARWEVDYRLGYVLESAQDENL